MSWFEALVLGVVQGITEFLPISSDGHLALFQHVFASNRGTVVDGGESLFFNVMLHLGTLAAILLYYRMTVRDVAESSLGKGKPAPVYSKATLIRGAFLAGVATLPAVVVGLSIKDWIESATANPWIAAAGFLVTAVALLMTLRMRGGDRTLEQTTWVHALLIGSAQALAILPGVSRSGMTISTALALGFTRPWAVGFSLLMAVPAITGAGVLELKELDPSRLSSGEVQQILAATVVSGLVGYLAVAALIRVVRAGWLWYFSVYLVCIATYLFVSFTPSGAPRHERGETSVDRAVPRVSESASARPPLQPGRL